MRRRAILHGYHRDQPAQYISIGEYGLTLDTIADAYLSNSLRMPADLLLVFNDLAMPMELHNDPEFGAVVELRQARLNGKFVSPDVV